MLQYDVFYSEKKVGTVDVRVEGLYYFMQCQCRKFTDAVCKLAVMSEKGSAELGVLVPEGSLMTLVRSMPIKNIGNEISRFNVNQKMNSDKAIVVAVDPNKPFPYISKLHHAKLLKNAENTQPQLMINRD